MIKRLKVTEIKFTYVSKVQVEVDYLHASVLLHDRLSVTLFVSLSLSIK